MPPAPRRFRVVVDGRNFPTSRPTSLRREPPRDRLLVPKIRLTDRETEVTAWIAHGKTYLEIATLLSISERTVRAHLENVCQKLNATNKTHAVALALMNNLIQF